MNDTKKFNPFRPNSPAPPGMFTGRVHELSRIDDAYLRLADDNPSHLMVVGERGIGKSSLLLFANMLACGKIEWLNKIRYNFLTVQFSIDRSLTQLGMIRKINRALNRQLRKEEKLLDKFEKTWNFLKRIEVAGTKISDATIDQETLFDDFVYSLADTCNMASDDNYLTQHGIKTKKDGLVILIDEADNASEELNLGTFLKTLSEALQVEGCGKILFVLSGLPRLRSVLAASHYSSLRLFEELELIPLKKKYILEIYERGLTHVNTKANQQYQISDEALEQMISVSEGYPHFAQQIGFSTFEENNEIEISNDTASKAIFKDNGAIDLIGDRYYRDMYYNQIREDAYREILNIMSENAGGVTTRKDLREKFSKKDHILDNGLRALKDRNIILPIQGRRGQYELQWIGFGIWIKFFTKND